MRAVLFIHGFSAKKIDNKYFIDKMNKMPNVKVYSYTLPGHENDKMSKVKYSKWIEASELELKKVLEKHKKVTIVAHSMGCIIATNLAARYKEVEKLVLIAPAFIYGNPKQVENDIKNIIRHKVEKDVGTGFEGAFRKLLEVPMYSWNEYLKMARANMKYISKITCPTLILYGTHDNLISLESIEKIYNKLNCPKDLVIIDRVRHQVFKSNKKDIITKYIYRFINFNVLYKLRKKERI